ncbi:CBS domain-containing protein [Vibrio brasiliensis]|jgi:CBS domain-containing protein|uniref:Inosine monophosphate dehydrogenase-related protein n=1 Tax=Vibrio brasiliensis LMG 20546 TaxID=945543 RepID=E8LU81_9VIBR|nr:CBS domain-containing protein [Vibrio brasiliensis]EGA65746.1 inosine monophosphate dehydrogenase-related protein [Vibrio brasiliensis LMG 20546]MCG9647050.1 CBS domain-containing protein [Vibrio brasiliensis]MCG9725886.1 CBS domain-containing protein [Vibrio brasiliensis]MCG9749818.1 CBS domain-containing protein [Vibrio brasiliensis]MCG9781241.1 CBS domain-containing protein [Vibrio brasiliensis]|tara:strand:+ start:77 stop:493 length:417 start_codon:yes stop_codon:yes gene_type:complete
MESLKVKDYMTLQAVTFTPEMSLSAALDKVMNSRYLGGPVINEQKEVIGFLSGQDLLDKLIKVSYYCQDSHIVSDCMHPEVISVTSETSIIELAEMMKVGRPKVYPVIDGGKLVGIITRRDVLRAIGKNIEDCFKHPV